MAGIPNGDFDERLAEALDNALIEGEEVVAREAGDQGQAIALTRSRLIILKVGLAASGELEGHKMASFALDTLTAVNFRKGPLGAVIQICAENAQGSVQSGTPDNVIVFTGPGRVKKAEAFATSIESVTGKPVNRVEPHAGNAPKFSREPKPLVEEVHAEVVQPQPAAVVETVTEAPKWVTREPVVLAYEPEPEEVEQPSEFIPNPNLPKPIRKHPGGPNKLLVALGVLAALTFVGMAVMAPLHEAENVTANSSDSYGSAKLLRLQVTSLSSYRKEVFAMMAKADRDASTFRAAICSGNKSAVLAASRSGVSDAVWQQVNALAAPSGLAEAKASITTGMLLRKNAIAFAAGAAGSPQAVDVRGTLARFDEAGAQLRKGLSAITAASKSLDRQVAELLQGSKKAKMRK